VFRMMATVRRLSDSVNPQFVCLLTRPLGI
jgi:hypothetical protein